MRVLICTPCQLNSAKVPYILSLLSETSFSKGCVEHNSRQTIFDKDGNPVSHTPSYIQIGFSLLNGYSGLGRDRSIQASRALIGGDDKVVFIDSDMSWVWEDLKELIDSHRDIVAGVVSIKDRSGRLNPTIKPEDRHCLEPEAGLTTIRGLERIQEKYGTREIAVTVTGTAFMAISRNALEKMAPLADPFFHTGNHAESAMQCYNFFPTGPLNNIYFGEDWGLCKLAHDAGFEVFINPDIRPKHIGDATYEVDPK